MAILDEEFGIIASNIQMNVFEDPFDASIAVAGLIIDRVGFCETVLDVRGTDFVCRTCICTPNTGGEFYRAKSLISLF